MEQRRSNHAEIVRGSAQDSDAEALHQGSHKGRHWNDEGSPWNDSTDTSRALMYPQIDSASVIAENTNYMPGVTETGNRSESRARQSWYTGDRTVPMFDAFHLQPTHLPPTPPSTISSTAISSRPSREQDGVVGNHEYRCAVCNAGFDTVSKLWIHLRRHGERPYVCKTCSNDFVFEKDLKRHYQTVHDPDARKYTCPVGECKYSTKGFTRTEHLARHLQSRHPAGYTGYNQTKKHQTPYVTSSLSLKDASNSSLSAQPSLRDPYDMPYNADGSALSGHSLTGYFNQRHELRAGDDLASYGDSHTIQPTGHIVRGSIHADGEYQSRSSPTRNYQDHAGFPEPSEIERTRIDGYDANVVPEMELDFSTLFTGYLLDSLSPGPSGTLEQGLSTLPDLLKAYSTMLGYKARSALERDVVFSIEYERSYITESFGRQLTSRKADSKLRAANITFLESALEITAGTDNRASNDTDIEAPEAREGHTFLINASEYEWLLDRFRTATDSTATGGADIEILHATISLICGRRAFSFDVEWDPIEFTRTQYQNATNVDLGSIICICGLIEEPEALTCGEYIERMWPTVGRQVLVALSKAVQAGYEVSQSGIRPVVNVIIREGRTTVFARASSNELIQVGETLAWLGAACRASTVDDDIQYCTPVVTPHDSGHPGIGRIKFTLSNAESSWPELRSNSQCWRKIFKNPTIAKGYPIKRRQCGERGLEIPLSMAATLGQAMYATTFMGLFLLKGFSSAFIPQVLSQTSIVWHYLVHLNSARLSYCEALRYQKIDTGIDVACLEGRRHFIGWSTDVQDCIGTKSVPYDRVEFTGKYIKKGGIAISGLQVGSNYNLTINVNVMPGKKDTRMPWKHDRPLKLYAWQATNVPVVVYDIAERCGSLIDGAALILYLSRAWLSHPEAPMAQEGRSTSLTGRFKHLDPSEQGRSSAYEILTDDENGDLELYTDWKWKDLVLLYCHLLEKIKDYRAELLGRQQWDVNIGSSLTGFCFMDILTMANPLRPRCVPLQRPAWLKFTEQADAISITGRSFGQLFRPAHSKCRYRDEVPSGQDLLIAQVKTLRMISRSNGEINADSIEIVEGVSWNDPAASFQECECSCTSHTKEGRCGVYCTTLDGSRKTHLKGKRKIMKMCAPISETHPSAAIVIGKKNGKLTMTHTGRRHDVHSRDSTAGASSSSGTGLTGSSQGSSPGTDSAIDMDVVE